MEVMLIFFLIMSGHSNYHRDRLEKESKEKQVKIEKLEKCQKRKCKT